MSAPNVVGLDLSISATGIALPDGTTLTIKPKPANLRGGARLSYLADRLDDLIKFSPLDLVVIEDYSPGAIGIAGKLANAQWRGVVEMMLHDFQRAAPVAFIKPNTLKRWATGNGAADKPAMVAAAIAAGWTGDPKRHDEADAYHLRAMGLQYLTGQGTAAQLEVCDSTAWPEATS